MVDNKFFTYVLLIDNEIETFFHKVHTSGVPQSQRKADCYPVLKHYSYLLRLQTPTSPIVIKNL